MMILQFPIFHGLLDAIMAFLLQMASSGIPGVTMDAVSYVQKSLLPDLSPAEAAAHFSRMIEDSLSSWFTQWNFFFHNLAQKRHPGDQNETDSINSGELLSFISGKYS